MTKDKDADEPKAPVLETFVPLRTFYGRPDDQGEEVTFQAGVESIPVSPEYAALIREKGLAAKK